MTAHPFQTTLVIFTADRVGPAGFVQAAASLPE